MAVTRSALTRASSELASELANKTISLINSRFITMIASACSVLYLSFWAVALLQNRGLIQTKLPIPVADRAVIERSHLELAPDAVSELDKLQRAELVQQAQIGPSSNAVGSPLTLDIQVTAPADLRVFDSKGNSTGMDPLSGASRLTIPNGSYSGHATSPRLVSIGRAAGSYRLQLLGSGSGVYTLAVRLMLNDDIDHARQYVGTGRIFQDTILQATINVDLANGQPQLTVSDIDALTIDWPAHDSQAAAVVRLNPPARLPLPIPLPGVVLPPDIPTLSLPGDSAAPPYAPSTDVQAVGSSGSAPGTHTGSWSSPSVSDEGTGVAPSNGGGGRAGSTDAPQPGVAATQPAADPSPAATAPPAATPSGSRSAAGSTTSSATPVATQASAIQSSPTAVSTPTSTPSPTPSPTVSASPTTTGSSQPSVTPTPTSGSGGASGGSGSNAGSGGSGSGTSNSNGGSSGRSNGSTHAQSAPGRSNNHGHSGSAPGRSGAPPGKAH